MEWLLDPSAWVGLLTLVVLEIVLGIDNLVFIAILVDKLPPAQQDRARVTGLTLALLMRLGLLSLISWIAQLTTPWLSMGPFVFSGRDLILLTGGFFLLLKGTIELHDRVEGNDIHASGERLHASFGIIVTQIVVLDAIFSLDAVVTAVGMVDHLAIMMLAVTIAIGIMLVASKPLTVFINAHPSVVILCLGFLLMIGFTLVAESFGFPIPKGYLYAAIAFSVMVEFLNQLLRLAVSRQEARLPLRERTAEAVLKILYRQSTPAASSTKTVVTAPLPDSGPVFDPQEHHMVSGVLSLADRSIHSIMTPRTDVSWLDLNDDVTHLKDQIINTPHSFFPVCRGSLDEVIGIGRARDMVADLIEKSHIDESRLREPIVVHESIGILSLMEHLKRSHGQQVLVTDEFGTIEGLVTPIDVFEAIAGEFPDEDETPDIIQETDQRWRVDGAADLHHLQLVLNTRQLVADDEPYSTLAGYLLNHFDHLPALGDSCELIESDSILRFTVLEVNERRITTVRVERILTDAGTVER